jgi:hypothetical protein
MFPVNSKILAPISLCDPTSSRSRQSCRPQLASAWFVFGRVCVNIHLLSDQIVEKAAAQMSHPNEEVVPIADTHEGMKKFASRTADGYVSIRKQLKYLMTVSLQRLALKNQDLALQMRLDELNRPSASTPTREGDDSLRDTY